ncbi:MAG: WGR domain-containing protein [Candidatus Eremiobacterota bacterium]
MKKRTFEFIEGTSSKFWSIWGEGTGHTVHFGRIGTEGQKQTKNFSSEEEAKKSYEKLIKEKSKKGYIEIIEGESLGKTFSCPPDTEEKKRYLIKMLKHTSSKFRSKALICLSDKKYISPEILQHITECLKDKHPSVRYSSAKTLGILCSKEYFGDILNKLDMLSLLTDLNNEKVKVIIALQELRKDEKPFVAVMAEEGLRKIDHKETIEDISKKALDKFPPELKDMLEREDNGFAEKFKAVLSKEKDGRLLEALYDIDNCAARKTLQEVILTANLPKYWNNIKSIYKRAEYRMDMELFGLLAYRIEVTPHQKAEYIYGSWFELNNTNIKNVETYALKDKQKFQLLKSSVPKNRLLSKEELTEILEKLNFEDQDIWGVMRYTLYYGVNYEVNDKIGKELKDLIESGKLEQLMKPEEQTGGIAGKIVEGLKSIVSGKKADLPIESAGNMMSYSKFDYIMKKMKFNNTESNLIRQIAAGPSLNAGWYELNDWNINNLSSFVLKDKEKGKILKTLPKFKLMRKKEFTDFLKEKGFDKKEIEQVMAYTLYYGVAFQIDDKTIEALKNIITENKLETVKSHCNKLMSQNEFYSIVKSLAFSDKEADIITKISSGGYIQHKSICITRFAMKTKSYLMRRLWRTFKIIAKKNPDTYAKFAYFFLKNFKDSDGGQAQKITKYTYDWHSKKFSVVTNIYDRFNHLWAFNHILYGNSKRFIPLKSGAKWRCAQERESSQITRDKFRDEIGKKINIEYLEEATTEASEREESLPSLWERDSNLLLKLLMNSECKEINAFAVKILRDKFPHTLTNLSKDDLLKLFRKPYPFVCNTIVEILRKHTEPMRIDRELLNIFLLCDFEPARHMAGEWLKEIIKNVSFEEKTSWLFMMLKSSYSDRWNYAIELIKLFCEKESKDLYFKILLELLKKGEREKDFYSLIVQYVKDMFYEELKLLSLEDVLSILNSPSRNVQDLGGWLLQNSNIDSVAVDRKILAGLACHDVFTVREGAKTMIKSNPERWQEDISLLLCLTESKWEDTRRFAIDFFEENFSVERFTPDIITGFCDSLHKDIQDFGKSLVTKYLKEGYILEFIRLTEHPDSNIQELALDLVIEKMPREPEKIKKLLPFFRTILFRVNKGRKMKDKLFKYLEYISWKNAFIAAEVMTLLEDYGSSMTEKDFSYCLTIMTGLKAKYPYIKGPVELLSGEAL